MKTTGAIGVGSIFAPMDSMADSTDQIHSMPTRPFGNTGVDVPILSFGGSLDFNFRLLRQAVKWGVTYWDTANSYRGGRSEQAVGNYFGKYPDDRKKIFLVTKSHAWTRNGMSRDLHESLERMKTDYIDLFFVHSVNNISELDAKTKVWAEKAKTEGKFRFFGFSTHGNMESCMLEGARLGWIDGIMMTYNYRLMHTDRMKRAMDACYEAGIGLTAMKTQGGGSVKTDTEIERKLAGHFVEKGFTPEQAKLKAVWENPYIASICSEMPNMKILRSNVTAATIPNKLAAQDMEMLRRYAHKTKSSYCAGCIQICESVLETKIPIGDVMRCLMYSRSYGEPVRAVRNFKKIPHSIRCRLTNHNYSVAEQKCPRKLPIGRLMKEAVEKFS
jgi:predicted aldo/keto reductase-like oxidoreductase